MPGSAKQSGVILPIVKPSRTNPDLLCCDDSIPVRNKIREVRQMRKLIFIALVLMACIVPAMAQVVNYNSPEDKAIYEILISCDYPTTATIDLQLLDGTTVPASWSYQAKSILGFYDGSESIITLDGQTESETRFLNTRLYLNIQTGSNFTEFKNNRVIMGASQYWGIMDISVEKYGLTSPIIGFTINSDNEVTYEVKEQSRDGTTKALKSGSLDELIKFYTGIFWNVYDFLIALFDWLKFFFVDNLLLIVALFLSVPMAFAAKNSRGNPEKFFRQYFKSVRGFFDFMLSMWRMLIETIGTVRGWFRL